MKNQEKVTELLGKFSDDLAGLNCDLIVIGRVEEEDESCIVGSLRGNRQRLTEALARIIANPQTDNLGEVLAQGVALGRIISIAKNTTEKVEVIKGDN